MPTKIFTDSFERDSKTTYRNLAQSFYICFTSADIHTGINKLSAILD